MNTSPIHCEFRVIEGSSSESDRFLTCLDLPAVPQTGELVNINGNPYLVHERSWALDVRGPACDAVCDTWCYFRVARLHAEVR